MNKLTEYISSQFQNPRGFVGGIITWLQNRINKAMYKSCVSLVELTPGDKTLDIGYGNGHLLALLYKKQPVELYGIDISDDARFMAEKKNKKAAQAGNLHLSVGDCCDLPYEDEMFDAVTSINTIYFWSDPVKGLSEIRRVLKPGKTFFNVVYSKEYLDKVRYTRIGYQKYTLEEMITFGKEAGYTKAEMTEIVHGDSFVVQFTK